MRIVLLFLALTFFVASCKNAGQKSRGAIVLGDSSTIITETDPVYLADFVDDIQLQNNMPDSAITTDTATLPKPVADTVTLQQAAAQVPVSGKGLSVNFSEVNIFIPGIETQSFRNQNLKNLNGVSYQLQKGNLDGNQLIIKDATVSSVKQRYITTVVVTKDGKKMELDDLDETTSWTELKGNKGIYPVKGLSATELGYKKATSGVIRTAVSRAARENRYSRTEIKAWEDAVKNVKSVTQPPASVVLQSVMWRVEGKDKNGKAFRKEVRIDMPL